MISDPDIGHWKIGHNDHGEGAGGAGGAEGSEGAELGRAAVAKGVSYGLPWVVVCTDGAWDVITNDEMVRIVADAEERWAACHRSEGGDTGGDTGSGGSVDYTASYMTGIGGGDDGSIDQILGGFHSGQQAWP